MFDKNDTLQKIVTIIAQTLNVDEKTIAPSMTLEALGADSLDRLEMIMKVEELFGIDISDDDEAHIKTIQDMVDTVHARRTK